MKTILKWLFALAVFLILASGITYLLYRKGVFSSIRDQRVNDWIRRPQDHSAWMVKAGQVCQDAPFQIPTDGFIGYLWDDSFQIGHRHQGIDIFSPTGSGKTPIYAAYDGYLSRNTDWKSSLIIRIPEDPLQPDRQIWSYYTHMADENGASFIAADFPPGTTEKFVKAGTLLGYQGNFSGTPGSPVGVHLHFSIVLSDSAGKYLNELNIENTLDPTPYFKLNLNAHQNQDEIPLCNP